MQVKELRGTDKTPLNKGRGLLLNPAGGVNPQVDSFLIPPVSECVYMYIIRADKSWRTNQTLSLVIAGFDKLCWMVGGRSCKPAR